MFVALVLTLQNVISYVNDTRRYHDKRPIFSKLNYDPFSFRIFNKLDEFALEVTIFCISFHQLILKIYIFSNAQDSLC